MNLSEEVIPSLSVPNLKKSTTAISAVELDKENAAFPVALIPSPVELALEGKNWKSTLRVPVPPIDESPTAALPKPVAPPPTFNRINPLEAVVVPLVTLTAVVVPLPSVVAFAISMLNGTLVAFIAPVILLMS